MHKGASVNPHTHAHTHTGLRTSPIPLKREVTKKAGFSVTWLSSFTAVTVTIHAGTARQNGSDQMSRDQKERDSFRLT